jgi:hypothetical protein
MLLLGAGQGAHPNPHPASRDHPYPYPRTGTTDRGRRRWHRPRGGPQATGGRWAVGTGYLCGLGTTPSSHHPPSNSQLPALVTVTRLRRHLPARVTYWQHGQDDKQLVRQRSQRQQRKGKGKTKGSIYIQCIVSWHAHAHAPRFS